MSIKIQQTKILLENKILDNIQYNSLPSNWKNSNIDFFSKDKTLFYYQKTALEKIASMMYLSFNNYIDDSPNLQDIENEYSKFLYIKKDKEQLNRACFWMATGSGKTLVLIKVIEHIDYLMQQNLIPKKEIMILLPKEDLIKQLTEQIKDFNDTRTKTIEMVNLLDYENYKRTPDLFNEQKIIVYYYRSDLMRNEHKDSIVDYKTYKNFGNWYLFLDEAHRGDNENSNLKYYVNELTKNGFLFNFSATFTDEIDKVTTCFNFNLEKFISNNYGKNIYLSDSEYTLNKRNDEFSDLEKQKQVLKSFIIYTIIKESKKDNLYHNPLIITLVNKVNDTEKNNKDSDLKIFCEYMLQIAQDKVKKKIFEEAKNELKKEFTIEKKYLFGDETLQIKYELIDNITLENIRQQTFNCKDSGQLEFFEGIKGKEIILKLQSSDKPFALIRIGNTENFIKNYLVNYNKLSTYNNEDWMSKINDKNSTINILLGSRAFYEGWDSNRPNIINMINIGHGDAKKYVPQSIGRGVRIQPNPNDKTKRQRLSFNDENKNKLLETLFIFPTDRKSINIILNSMSELGKNSNRIKRNALPIEQNYSNNKKFDLLLPFYKEIESENAKSLQFAINEDCRERFNNIFKDMSISTFLLKHHNSTNDTWTLQQYNLLKKFMNDNNNFINDDNKIYYDLNNLVYDLKKHINTKEQVVNGIRKLIENDEVEENNDIIHFKHIEVELGENDYKTFVKDIDECKNYGKYSEEEIIRKISNHEISVQEAQKFTGKDKSKKFTYNNESIVIQNISNHYYLPLIYSENDKNDYINHIIKNKSEKDFILNLVNFIDKNNTNNNWMFSKIDETLDKKIYIPYFYDNEYRKFFPDFVFWIKNGLNYKIVFVDPKGTSHANYQFKIDGFKKLFDNKDFYYKNKLTNEEYKITIDLKLIGDTNKVPKEYKKYWLNHNDFSFLM